MGRTLNRSRQLSPQGIGQEPVRSPSNHMLEAYALSVSEILTHERLKANIGDAVRSINVDTPFTAKAIAKRASCADSTVLIMMKGFLKREWVKKGPETDDGRETWIQTMKMRRGWETYREALRDVVDGSPQVIDPEEEARLRLAQQGVLGEWT